MLRSAVLLAALLSASMAVWAQEAKPSIYDPSLDAREEIAKMVQQAKVEGKHVLLQVGGNW